MTTATPPRSHAQRFEALRGANRIRAVRSEVKRGLRTHSTSDAAVLAAELIRETPDDLRSMRVRDLLDAIPKVGEVRRGRILLRTDTSASKTLGGLTGRQRGALRDELELVG